MVKIYLTSTVKNKVIIELIDSNTFSGYILRMNAYLGRQFEPLRRGLFGTAVVIELLQQSHLLRKGYHVFVDSFFSSLNLSKRLLEEATYMTGNPLHLNKYYKRDHLKQTKTNNNKNTRLDFIESVNWGITYNATLLTSSSTCLREKKQIHM